MLTLATAVAGIWAPPMRVASPLTPSPLGAPSKASVSREDGRRALTDRARDVEGCLLRHQRRKRVAVCLAGQKISHGTRVPVDATLLASVLQELRLDDCEPLMRVLPEDLVTGASGPRSANGAEKNLREFVCNVRDKAATNPLLGQLAHGLASTSSSEEGAAGLPARIDDAEMYELVHYCLLLDAVTRALAADPALAELVYERLKHTVLGARRQGVRALHGGV